MAQANTRDFGGVLRGEVLVLFLECGVSLHQLLAYWPYVCLDDWADIKRSSKKKT